MAEIRVEQKRSSAPVWLIILLLLIAAAVAAYFFMGRQNAPAPQTQTAPSTTQTHLDSEQTSLRA